MLTNKFTKESSKIIGIAGDSGSGKSSLLSFFKNLWGDDLLIVEGDCFHKWERKDFHWKNMTPLNPEANYLDKAYEVLSCLKNGESCWLSEYNHSTGKFDEPKEIFPKPKIIFCGLHSLYTEELRSLEDVKIYLNTDENLRIHWKYKRDIEERGYSKEDIDKEILKRSIDSKVYIAPQIDYADIVISIGATSNSFDKLNLSFIMNKNFKYINEVMHFVKNTPFRVLEDENRIYATFSEIFQHFKNLNF